MRVYEATGVPAEGEIGIPEEFGGYALADGLQEPVEDFRACAGRIPLELRGFEVRGYLLRRGG